ncbi:uncharacterized protein LOC112093679 [Morus notabilis]|uniref:uncharacterized protein LOC112093679 n=1 Tax=Morus notabilis TaxID=981085 RepID=UPI000CED07DE|nr:uncharacterized protein LOC112093679 [Morus notabilis]
MQRREEGRGSIRSWRQMKELLKSQFLPIDYEQILYLRLQNCAQGGRSVRDYAEEFLRLSARNNLHESGLQQVARFIRGAIAATKWVTSPTNAPSRDLKQISLKWRLNRRHEPSQRHAIFKTKCTINSKVCNVIIDRGSSENVVSRNLVKTLGLKATKHLQPYKIGWVKKGVEVRVDEVCQVPFSIDKFYKDEVECDVIDMDACHVLLGWPLEFNMKALHNGHENTYQFEWKGRKIVLLPHKDQPIKPIADSLEKKVMLSVSGATFQKDMKGEPFIFALVLKEAPEENAHVSPSLQSLLQDFGDLTSEELPSTLPPIRDIQHHIDLVPGAALPNLPHYRISLKENEILQGIIDELLTKKLIRPSLSPCAVLALLVPNKDNTWWMCVDSRAINKIIVKYRFPISRFEDMLNKLEGSTVFSKLDLRSGYHQI